MPRPLKPVSPNTLGGVIRSARQKQDLSLAQVAGEKYSTSLISQIERNRIEPSVESLEYLAERLHLSLEELMTLAHQSREPVTDESKLKSFDDTRVQASQLLAENRPRRASELLENLNMFQIPPFLRWRLIALRGQCNFSLRKFQLAQRDFLAAVAILPEAITQDQMLEAMTLRLHLAAATRELGQLEAAYGHYHDALAMMNASTPIQLVAEAHWGLTLVVFERANISPDDSNNAVTQADYAKAQKRIALNHAENARTLYRAIDEMLRVALLDCQIALIEQSLGNLSAARERLQRVLDTWLPTLDLNALASLQPPVRNMQQYRYSLKERANVVSAAACYLASVEHAEQFDDQALLHIQQALDAGEMSYILRRAEAYMLKGQILADRDIEDPEAEKAFRAAIHELEPTDRVAAKIRIHDILGRHLLKQGRDKEGDQELDKARSLANFPTTFSPTTSAEDALPYG
jgi:transcriptional regulator with XRE-family HTH domain